MRTIAVAATLLVVGFAAPGVARAQSCTVEPQDLSLGDYDPFAAAPQDSVGNVSVRCDVATSFGVALGPGTGSFAARRMAGGNQMLLYNLFLDPSRTMVWGDGSNGTGVLSRTSVGGDFPVYARAAAGQATLRPGPYADVISVIVTY